MAQPETRKYQLFPREHQSTSSPVKVLAPDEAFALAMGQNTDKADKLGGGLRFRFKEHNLPARRRKVSVPELGPMTTVHESSMDSPTIPGRPVLHERSISVPGTSWKTPNFTLKTSFPNQTETNMSPVPRPSVSTKDLPPPMVPSQTPASSPLKRQLSLGRLRSGNSNKDTARSARPDDSPKARSPSTPLSATHSISTTPGSATTAFSSMSTSTLPTPVSSVPEGFHGSPRSWRTDSLTPTSDAPTEMSTPAVESQATSSNGSHRRNVSDSSSIAGSIMDRGRPKKSIDGVKRSNSKTKSAERRAFETLPKGWRVPNAMNMLDSSETVALNKQALQQAGRFEVLRKSDVDSLSRELRNLDERCEYLRRTYHSLRAGRRNLHSRICSYLRSPRTIKFSQESLLKQEEALAELDNSIDDWVNKLEQAENRRTRVRQKLLEHVAAAVTLPVPGGVVPELQLALGITSPNAPTYPSTPPRSPIKEAFTPQTESVSPSSRVVAQVPSTIIEQPIIEEAAVVGLGIAAPPATPVAEPATIAGIRRAEVESIRIYAGDEVAALLADVEQEINRMSLAGERNAVAREKNAATLKTLREQANATSLSEQERRELHRARSAEALQAGVRGKSSTASLRTVDGGAASHATNALASSSPRATTPTVVEKKEEDLSCFMLSAAVFNPKATVVH